MFVANQQAARTEKRLQSIFGAARTQKRKNGNSLTHSHNDRQTRTQSQKFINCCANDFLTF